MKAKSLNVGDVVYFLSDYHFVKAEVLKLNQKTAKLLVKPGAAGFWQLGFEQNIPYYKIAHESESVCVVWETWKGVNGRGGYRIEREMYPDIRVKASSVQRAIWHGPQVGRIIEEKSPYEKHD